MKKYGELMVDHRASPGIPAELAQRLGYHPTQVAEGKLFETATVTCQHCGTVYIINPLRTRERGHCFQCNDYVCDPCAAAMREPGYVHTPRQKVVDLVQSGRYTVTGTSVHPVLIPKEREDG